MSTRIDGATFTDQQIEMLRRLGKSTVGMDKTTGFEDRTITTLAVRGLCEIDEEVGRATITDKGRELLPKLKGETTAAAPAPTKPQVETNRGKRGTKPRSSETEPAPRESPPPTDKVDIAALRAALDAQYAADIAALDRVAEIQRAASA